MFLDKLPVCVGIGVLVFLLPMCDDQLSPPQSRYLLSSWLLIDLLVQVCVFAPCDLSRIEDLITLTVYSLVICFFCP